MSDVTDNKPELPMDTLELINTELIGRLARQAEARAQIDTKAVVLVGYVAAASSFLATRHSQPVLTWLALAAFAIAAGFGVAVFAVRKYKEVPIPQSFFNKYGPGPKSAALTALATARVYAFEQNEPKNKHKVWWWRTSLVTLMIGIALMFAALYVHTGSHDPSVRLGQRPAAGREASAIGPSAGRSGRLASRRQWPTGPSEHRASPAEGPAIV
jgi:hypothetical protein